jgi:hypothetical protein
MREIKIKKYDTIEDMNFNYNVLIYYKNKISISSDLYKSLDSFKAYVDLILDMEPILDSKEIPIVGYKEIRRSYWALLKLINDRYKDNTEDYITKSLKMNVINEYIKIAF